MYIPSESIVVSLTVYLELLIRCWRLSTIHIWLRIKVITLSIHHHSIIWCLVVLVCCRIHILNRRGSCISSTQSSPSRKSVHLISVTIHLHFVVYQLFLCYCVWVQLLLIIVPWKLSS